MTFLKKIFLSFFTKNFFNSYNYLIEPIQLAKYINEISNTSKLEGSIVEIGVFRGSTTAFALEHMKSEKINKKYFALDTFEGFTKSDINYEVLKRNKKKQALYNAFKINNEKLFNKNLSNYKNLITIKCDCADFNFDKIGPIAVCLIDVDLYLPTKIALKSTYKNLIKGGTILVDDCANDRNFDGSYLAYKEFIKEQNLEEAYIGKKCGLLKK